MRAEAPEQFLQAHAITSRSWLLAMLERCQRKPTGTVVRQPPNDVNQLIRWYGREDHADFDVCADDHCQRYQGTTKIISAGVASAVAATRGRFLTYEGQICDARFSKACGGRTETFETTWEEIPVPYLSSVADAPLGACSAANLTTEAEAEAWILSRPEAYCNTEDRDLLQQVLPDFDQETTDFFRWTVQYQREELEAILRAKSGVDFGMLLDLVPVQRGPSGRLVRLRVQGSERDMIVGKELEIRRWLARTHLYSSAFVPRIDRDDRGIPKQITLHGAGWGHGVGLCQIGAAVMAARGRSCEEILLHYFPGSHVTKLY
jgi:SpoIID/LytB domain protein